MWHYLFFILECVYYLKEMVGPAIAHETNVTKSNMINWFESIVKRLPPVLYSNQDRLLQQILVVVEDPNYWTLVETILSNYSTEQYYGKLKSLFSQTLFECIELILKDQKLELTDSETKQIKDLVDKHELRLS